MTDTQYILCQQIEQGDTMDIGFFYDLRHEESARAHALAFADAITARGGSVRMDSFRYPGSDLKGGFHFHVSGIPAHEASAILDSIRAVDNS